MITNGRVQLYPFLRVALMLVVGVVVGEAYSSSVAQIVYASVAVALVVASLFCWRKPVLQTCLVFVAVTVVGAWYTAHYVKVHETVLPKHDVETRVAVMSRPVVKGRVVRFDALGVGGACNGRMLKVTLLRDDGVPCADSVRLGDGLVLWSVLKSPADVTRSQRGRFDYSLWLRTHDFVAQTFVLPGNWKTEVLRLTSVSKVQRLRLAALRLRDRLLKNIGSTLDDETLAVVSAMALGDKSSLDKELKERYSVSGASHLLALSGLHLSVIYVVLSLIVVRRRWNVWGQVAAVAAIWGYVLLVGMPASVVRAALMITLYASAAAAGNDGMVGNNIGIAATLMLLFNPYCLWDVGFQMSFAAVLAIFVFFLPIYRVVPKEWTFTHCFGRWVWTVVAVSVAAQIGVAPLVLYYFGRFSCYFLLTNIVAIPLATVVIYLALTFLCTSFVPYVSTAVALVLGWAVKLLDWSVGAVASLPGASIDGLYVGRLQLFLIYVFIGCMYMVSRYCWKVYCFLHYRVNR